MIYKDILEESTIALSANKGRTFLTMLGIIIGIGSVIAMVSIGQGAQQSIESSIEGLGSNLLTVFPGALQPGRGIVSSGRGSSQSLKNEDVPVLAAIPGVFLVAPELDRRFQVISPSGNNTNVTVVGATEAYSIVRNLDLISGSFISDINDRSIGRVAVLGPTVMTDLFGENISAEDVVGQVVRISGGNFKVLGVLTAKGGSSFSSTDNMVFVPLSTMQKILAGSDSLTTISISVTNKDDMPAVQDAATEALLIKHRVDEPDFSIISQQDILGTLTQVTDAFTLFLASIAGISLFVGGIGIMNMMLTTVTERTKEIGLRKAVGATARDINIQFLSEAIMLTLIGGVIGILVGSLISLIINQLDIIQTRVSLFSVLLSFGVSGTIGIVFGYYPARRASRMNPIEALRYE